MNRPRGQCPTCARDVALRLDGRVRAHGYSTRDTLLVPVECPSQVVRSTLTPGYCPGSHQRGVTTS